MPQPRLAHRMALGWAGTANQLFMAGPPGGKRPCRMRALARPMTPTFEVAQALETENSIQLDRLTGLGQRWMISHGLSREDFENLHNWLRRARRQAAMALSRVSRQARDNRLRIRLAGACLTSRRAICRAAPWTPPQSMNPPSLLLPAMRNPGFVMFVTARASSRRKFRQTGGMVRSRRT
jgi:hypothetical protein